MKAPVIVVASLHHKGEEGGPHEAWVIWIQVGRTSWSPAPQRDFTRKAQALAFAKRQAKALSIRRIDVVD